METDINIPKTKGVNVLFQSLKFHAYIYIFVSVSEFITTNQSAYCTEAGQSLLHIMKNGCVCLLIFNSVGLFYVWCRESFSRLEFWLIYVLNFLWFAGVLFDIYSTIRQQPQECIQIIMMQKTFLVLSIKNQFELIIALVLPLEFAAKFVNMASNLIFPYLLLSSGKDLASCHESENTIMFAICFVHGFVNILASFTNLVLMCMGRKGKKLSTFRFFVMVALIGFIIVYIIVYLAAEDVKQEAKCVPLEFVLRGYVYINPIAVVGMLTILLSVKSDLGGDVRSLVLTQQHKNEHGNDYAAGGTSKIGGAYGVLSQANHTDKSKVTHLKHGFGTLKN